MSVNVEQLTITQALEGFRSKSFTVSEVIDACFKRIHEYDGNIKAFLTLNEKEARALAEQYDAQYAKGEPVGPLAGIPIAVKDIICTKGLRTTASSKMLEHYVPPYDATIVAKLKEAGAIIVGKVNCDEFAHGASTENSAYGPSHNPWDITRSPGGSSGGSSAALSAGFCLASLGTDTGGSTRQPGGWCNIYGLRPTYGRVSRYGLMSMTSSTDTPGIFARTAHDTALLLSILSGHDPHDATSLPSGVEAYHDALERSLQGMTIGLPKEFFEESTHPGSEEVVSRAIAQFESLGATIKHVSLPHTKYGIAVYYIITPSELSSNLGRFDGIRYGHRDETAQTLSEVYMKSRGTGFGPEAKRRIMLGTYALSSGYYDAYYKKAQKVRTVITKEVEKVLQEVDLILTPVSPHPAIVLGEKNNDPLSMYLEDVYLETAVMAGLPALSVPAGFTDGLPVGIQLMGKQLDEKTVLAAAHQYEKATNWTTKYPTL